MYSFTGRVRYSEVDEDWNLKVPSIIDYFQDCTTFQTDALGLGQAHIQATGRSWLLAGWEIEVDTIPHFGDEIRVSTWATGVRGLMASRNFTICRADDATGERPLVRADSTWFLFDAAKGRPVRPEDADYLPYQRDADENGDQPLDMPKMERHIRAEGDGEATAPVIVTTAHIDTNHHVNNAQYVAMAQAALPEADAGKLRRLDVRYTTAAKLGDTIYPHVHRIEGGYIVTLDDAETGGRPYATVRARG